MARSIMAHSHPFFVKVDIRINVVYVSVIIEL